MTSASHAEGSEFDSRCSYISFVTYKASLVQWLEFFVANEEARVQFPDDAYFLHAFIHYINNNKARLAQLAARRSHNPKVVGSIPTLCTNTISKQDWRSW